MRSKIFFTGFIIFHILFFWPQALSYKYGFDLLDEDVFTPCEMDDVNYAIDYVDLTNMHFEFLDDGRVYAYGEIVLIKDIGEGMIPATAQIYKKSRGHWIHTLYNLKRSDTCVALYNPQELWHAYVENIPQEQRICPFEKGMIFPINTTSEIKIPDLPDPRLEGDYKLQLLFDLVGINEVACAKILLNIYRM